LIVETAGREGVRSPFGSFDQRNQLPVYGDWLAEIKSLFSTVSGTNLKLIEIETRKGFVMARPVRIEYPGAVYYPWGRVAGCLCEVLRLYCRVWRTWGFWVSPVFAIGFPD